MCAMPMFRYSEDRPTSRSPAESGGTERTFTTPWSVRSKGSDLSHSRERNSCINVVPNVGSSANWFGTIPVRCQLPGRGRTHGSPQRTGHLRDVIRDFRKLLRSYGAAQRAHDYKQAPELRGGTTRDCVAGVLQKQIWVMMFLVDQNRRGTSGARKAVVQRWRRCTCKVHRRAKVKARLESSVRCRVCRTGSCGLCLASHV